MKNIIDFFFQFLGLNPSSISDVFIFWITIVAIVLTFIFSIKWIRYCVNQKKDIKERYRLELKEINLSPLLPENFLPIFYQELGREKDLSMEIHHTTTNWALTLISAVLIAYFVYYQNVEKNPYLSLGFLLLILGVIFRFFVRSIMEYNNLLKWNDLRKKTLLLIINYENRNFQESFKESYALFVSLWRAYRPAKELILSNLRLGYFYILALVGFLAAKNIFLLPNKQKLIGIIWLMALVIIEFYFFLTSRYFLTPVRRKFEVSKICKSLEMMRKNEKREES